MRSSLYLMVFRKNLPTNKKLKIHLNPYLVKIKSKGPVTNSIEFRLDTSEWNSSQWERWGTTMTTLCLAHELDLTSSSLPSQTA
jgi:hypothetical protein